MAMINVACSRELKSLLRLGYLIFLLYASACLGRAQTTGPRGTQDKLPKKPPVSAIQAKPPQVRKAPAAKSVSPRPTLPPILSDFSSFLASPTKNATSTELKSVSAFVTSDKERTYLATVQVLAPDYAIVTDPLPAEEKPVSVLIGDNQGGKRSILVRLSFSEVTKNVLIAGDFSSFAKATADLACNAGNECAVLLADDGVTTIGQVTALRLSPTMLSLTYRASAAANPVALRLQNATSKFQTIPFSSKPFNQERTVEMRQVIAGDFCQEDENGDCNTDFLKPKHPSRRDHRDDLHSAEEPAEAVADQYVLGVDDSAVVPAVLNVLGRDTADISFNASPNFKPGYLVLVTANQSYRFAYTPAPTVHTSNLNYESEELSTVCDQVPDPADATKKVPDCDHTPNERLSVKSFTTGSKVGYVAMSGGLIVVRVTSAFGQEPNAVTVSNVTTKKSVIARRTVKPGSDAGLLNVDMTIMDQTTASRNYGNRIAKRYVAVTLDVKNPTEKKVQFNKSAIYFDVDYVESREQGPTLSGFVQAIGMVSTLGLYQPNAYSPPFVAGRKKNQPPRVARFGLEQNVKHSPENYLSMLGSFDYTTAKTDDKLRAVELLGSILTNIATGGVVADASGAFKAGTAVFSGTFLPGVRSIVLDTSFINRLRSNLVAQTFQETIQVPAKGSTTTVVLLPRTGILSFTDAQVSVMVKRVIDVHLVEEVVSGTAETPVKKNECTVGNTKEQTRQALGEPSGATTSADNTTSSFTFLQGPIASADFDAKGLLTGCRRRTNTEQLDLAKTLVDAKQTLTDIGISATQIELTDGSTVLVDIPGVQKFYHYDAKGAVAAPYTFLFKEVAAEGNKANESQSQFQAFLDVKAASLSAARASEIKDKEKNSDGTPITAIAGQSLKYPSPDIKNGFVVVTFKKSSSGKDVVVDKITFQGDQPKSNE